MKNDVRKGMECVENKFLKLPNIQKYEVDRRSEDGFVASVEMDDGFEFRIYGCFLQQAFPSTVMQLIEKRKKDAGAFILVSPYISDRTAQICEENGIGYFDHAGNCLFVGHSIYLSERGNRNPQPKQYNAVSIFERSSVVSSLILRELFEDIGKVWKLKHLSEKIGCSIGQVSKVMGFLVRNAWAVKTAAGYAVSEPGLMFPGEGHIGSVDVDVLINHLALHDEGYQNMARILQGSGYREHPDKYFSFFKTVEVEGVPYDVVVDILAGMYGGTQPKKRSQHVQGIKALKATGGNFAFDFPPQKIHVEAKRPDGAVDTANVSVVAVVPFLIMKAAAMGRGKAKDAYMPAVREQEAGAGDERKTGREICVCRPFRPERRCGFSGGGG